MSDTAQQTLIRTEDRARLSAGMSSQPIYRAIARVLAARHAGGGTLLDVGCGKGDLWPFLANQFDSYCGVDVVRYEGFPATAAFFPVDLETGNVNLPDGYADVVVSAETIEHLENPRAFARSITRLVKPGGWIIVTTPNQVSFLSKLTLMVFNEFNAFRAGSYPAHLTALLEVDLRRIASECGWKDVAVEFTREGRIPGGSLRWPRCFSKILPRSFSDNIVVAGRRP